MTNFFETTVAGPLYAWAKARTNNISVPNWLFCKNSFKTYFLNGFYWNFLLVRVPSVPRRASSDKRVLESVPEASVSGENTSSTPAEVELEMPAPTRVG